MPPTIASPPPLDLCDPATAHAVARRAGLSLKHRLGQHLLVDRETLEAVVEALSPGPDDTVLEIGPGIGTLTVELARRARRIVALELDEAAIRACAITLHDHPTVTVVHQDALRFDPDVLGLPQPWLAAGNIPYTITGALIAHLLEGPRPPARAVLLVQREVAARLAAGPGDWSLATVAVRTLATVERLRDIPPSSFEPPPAVHSSVLRLTPVAAMDAGRRRVVIGLARAAFQLRRKVLRHGITRAMAGDERAALTALDQAGIDPGRRPGTLTLAEWEALAVASGR